MFMLYLDSSSAVRDSDILKAYPLTVRNQTVPILIPSCAIIDSDTDESLLLSSSSSESQSPPASIRSSKKLPVSSVGLDNSVSKGKMVDTAISTPTTPRPSSSSVLFSEELPQHLLDGAAPADMIQYLSSPDCIFTAEEKAHIYKEIIEKSVLAFNAETGLSRFSWIHKRIAEMDESTKAATLLHSDYTIASLCKAFLASLDADGLSLTSDTVTKAYVRDVVGRERVRAESESNKTNSLLRDLLGDRYPRNRAGNKSSEARATPLRFKGDSPPCPRPSALRFKGEASPPMQPNFEEWKQEGGEGSDDKRTAPAATESAAETKLAALREQIAQKNREIENKRSDLANYEILKRNHEVQKGELKTAREASASSTRQVAELKLKVEELSEAVSGLSAVIGDLLEKQKAIDDATRLAKRSV